MSVTYGSPRNHIWTFAVGRSKDTSYPGNCPCATLPGPALHHIDDGSRAEHTLCKYDAYVCTAVCGHLKASLIA